jgi:hypothetical protein
MVAKLNVIPLNSKVHSFPLSVLKGGNSHYHVNSLYTVPAELSADTHTLYYIKLHFNISIPKSAK